MPIDESRVDLQFTDSQEDVVYDDLKVWISLIGNKTEYPLRAIESYTDGHLIQYVTIHLEYI